MFLEIFVFHIIVLFFGVSRYILTIVPLVHKQTSGIVTLITHFFIGQTIRHIQIIICSANNIKGQCIF